MVIKKSCCRLTQLQQCSDRFGIRIVIAAVSGEVYQSCSACLLPALILLLLLEILTSVPCWDGRGKKTERKGISLLL